MNWWHNFWNREDLSPNEDGSYLIRWRLAQFRGRRVYLHHILATDWAREPHDHPKDFISIGLMGRYVEEIYRVDERFRRERKLVLWGRKRYTAPWIRRFRGELIHRLCVHHGETAWTICLTSRPRREWGFFSEDGSKTPCAEFIERHTL